LNIIFSEPELREVNKRVIKYELRGVAFVDADAEGKGVVRFTFESDYGRGFRLIMDSSYYGKFLYDYFRQRLDAYAIRRVPHYHYAAWRVPEEKLKTVIGELSKSMTHGKEWGEGFRTILHVYYKDI
jgi:hypothetical protein